MSLNIWLKKLQITSVYDANITHNLIKMADAAGIYRYLWYPKETGITKAEQLIKPLENAIINMKGDPDYYKTFDASNGWGTYKDFLPWLEGLLVACKENPDVEIKVSI